MNRFFLLAVLTAPAIMAQTSDDPVVLTIDVENAVIYRGTVFDASKLAKDPGPTTSVNQAFVESINIGDIVAINGKPAKGTWSSTAYATPFRSAPQPGQPIADFDLAGTNFCTWQIYATDGTFLGMIRDSGAGQGHTVVGAWLAFLAQSAPIRRLDDHPYEAGFHRRGSCESAESWWWKDERRVLSLSRVRPAAGHPKRPFNLSCGLFAGHHGESGPAR